MPTARRVPVTAALLCLAPAALGQATAFDNFGPGNAYNNGSGYFFRGPNWVGSSPDWTQGFLFTSLASGGITEVLLPLEYTAGTNDFRFEFRLNDNDTPGALVGEILNVQASFNSADPMITVPGDASIQLAQGQPYWIILYAVNDAACNWRQNNTGSSVLRALSRNQGATWTYATLNAPAFRITVSGTVPSCYANCDGSTTAPVLNVADFTCFLQRFAAGESYANCDQSTAVPTLNVADFTCFLQSFAAGCN